MTAVAERIRLPRTRVGSYLSGQACADQDFVTELLRVTVPDPRMRERRQAEALVLLRAALNPARARSAAVPADGPGIVSELIRARTQQVEVYDRLTRSLEQQAELERAVNNSAQLVTVLLQMLRTLDQRVGTLSAERDRLRATAGESRALKETQRQLARALDQERRAKEEFERAEEKRRQAEALAARVQEQVRALTDELDRLRAAGPVLEGDPDQEPDTTVRSAPNVEAVIDAVGDDIEQALSRAAAVNDADDQTLRRITDALRDDSPDGGSEIEDPSVLSGVTDTSSPKSSGARSVALDLVVPLLKASLDVASKQAQRPIDSPAGRIVSLVARRDMDNGNMEGLSNLFTGLAFTLSYMLPAMAVAQSREPEEVMRQLVSELRARDGNSNVPRVIEELSSAQGLATVGAEIMAADQVDFLNLVTDLADFTAEASVVAAHLLECPLEEVWAEVEAGLHE
ncbi:hypothetical protein [Kitasatospora sp. CB02891]|uniref:hypothetical protein n=1 Tax=Kitasatospora sp. CB02891 TaxID=2020329 RepID=UPI000C2740E1|nr:hypothetical protein [Kitasatospora sp. CB02891]PJN24397.1 hypothetical protein CG736_17130 [Kitasatospora sp. CB02891]